MAKNYDNIFTAHFKAKLPLILWGSSGYGKTSLVSDFATRNHFELITLHAQYLDPLSLFIPSTQEMKELGYVKVYPSEILHRIFSAKQKTILFLDELTRAREETFNILTELLLDRAVFGYRIPPHVMILAASNFVEEDAGVRELPDAVIQRLTHLVHAPRVGEIVEKFNSKIIKELIGSDTKIIAKPGRFAIYDSLKSCPRQIDACGMLAEQGLNGEDLMEVCRGRIGIEFGTELAMRMDMKVRGKMNLFPEQITTEEFSRILKAEKEAGVMEVVKFLHSQMANVSSHAAIALYLLEFANPETCRAMQVHGFSFVFDQAPTKLGGGYFSTPAKVGVESVSLQTPSKPWQWFAIKLGKLTSK